MHTLKNADHYQKDENILNELVSKLVQTQQDLGELEDPKSLKHVDVLDKYRLGAAQGDPKAQYHLGLYHEAEKQEEAEAIRLFDLAAAQEHDEALFHLGNLYEKGLCGLKRNPVEAVQLYGRAVQQAFAPAIEHLKSLYERGLYGLTKANKAYNLQSLKGLEKHNHAINEQAKILNNFLQLCQGLQGAQSEREYRQLEQRLTTLMQPENKEASISWEAFLAIRKALMGEMNAVKDTTLQLGLSALGEEWQAALKAHAEFLKLMGNLQASGETLKIRLETHLAYTEYPPDADFLSDAKAAEISLKVAEISTKIAELKGGMQTVPQNLIVQQHQYPSFLYRTESKGSESPLGVLVRLMQGKGKTGQAASLKKQARKIIPYCQS